jgi:hypothetical protein
MKLKIKDLTFEWTPDNELVIEIDKGAPQASFIDGEDITKLMEFINDTP